MQWIVTEDGSHTLKNHDYGETYHSKSGAWSESQFVFLRPFLERSSGAKKKEWRVLDVGFGLGYNWLCYVNSFLHRCTPLFADDLDQSNCYSDHKIHLVSLEKDKQILDVALEPKLLGTFPAHQDAFDLLAKLKYDTRVESAHVKAELMVGDALDHVNLLSKQERTFDVILQDPFSPKRNPACWDPEFFRALRNCCHEGSMLLTYSVARTVREGLEAAGFTVEKVSGFGCKREQLIAVVE